MIKVRQLSCGRTATAVASLMFSVRGRDGWASRGDGGRPEACRQHRQASQPLFNQSMIVIYLS